MHVCTVAISYVTYFCPYLPAAESKITRALLLSSSSAAPAALRLRRLGRSAVPSPAAVAGGCGPPCSRSPPLPVGLATLGASNINRVVVDKEILNVTAPVNQGY